MEAIAMVRAEAEVKAGLETSMVAFCTRHNIVRSWSVAQHAKFQHGEVMDVVETGDAIDADEAKFRIFVILRTTANYSAWRQAHEGEGKPLAAGTGRGTKSLVGEYGDLE